MMYDMFYAFKIIMWVLQFLWRKNFCCLIIVQRIKIQLYVLSLIISMVLWKNIFKNKPSLLVDNDHGLRAIQNTWI